MELGHQVELDLDLDFGQVNVLELILYFVTVLCLILMLQELPLEGCWDICLEIVESKHLNSQRI